MSAPPSRFIDLPMERQEYADYCAAARKGEAFLRGRVHLNNLTGGFDELFRLERMGTRCEAAGQIYFNPIRWNAFAVRIKGLPDLGDFIDVKGCGRDTDRLVLQPDYIIDDFAYVQVFGTHHPEYAIGNWIWGWEGRDEKFRDDPKGGRSAYFIKPWRSPEELWHEVRRRQKDGA
jgi:hypothetical protein